MAQHEETKMSINAGYRLVKNCGRWKWELAHQNGTVLAISGTDYSRKSDAKRAFNRAAAAMSDVAFFTPTTA